MGSFSYDFEADLEDPILKNDIQLSPNNLAFLEANREKCFLCKWLVEDYKKNGTFTGVKQSGDLGVSEIFPIRGEINHLWLELYQKPYPFKKKVSKYEEVPASYAPVYPPETFIPPPGSAVVAPRPGTVPPPPQPEIVKDIESTPVSKPKRG
jgi:hypothetical protein